MFVSANKKHISGLFPCALWVLALLSLTGQWDRAAAGEKLLGLDHIQYQGAFRIKASVFGESEINWAQGPLAYNPANDSLFVVGHAHHQAIAEFKLPNIKKTDELKALDMVKKPLQPFARVLTRVSGGNPQELNHIGGLALVQTDMGPRLLVNAYLFYDAAAKVTHTTCVVRDPMALKSSAIDGFYSFRGGAGHTSGWMAPIPKALQADLGGNYLTGQSSGLPIIGRLSVGPSLFAFTIDPADGRFAVPSREIPTIKCLDFSLNAPLHKDLDNAALNNTLWTHLSRVTVGFIPPEFNTYVTLGYSGGHRAGVCYKCAQDNSGKPCPGYCSKEKKDNDLYYWLWDLSDIKAVRNGAKKAHLVRPYAHGRFPAPFPCTMMGGGTFDPASGRLFVTLQEADTSQGRYDRPPLIAVYQIGTPGSSQKKMAPIAPITPPPAAPAPPKPAKKQIQPEVKNGKVFHPIIYPGKQQ